MPAIRKRKAEAEASPSPPPLRQRRDADSDSSEAVSDAEANSDNEGGFTGGAHDQSVKKLVRLALASEYTRQPLRRADITAKVLAPNNSRALKTVFQAAQAQLQSIFGMTMTELPSKEKVTISQKRAAQKANGNSQGNSSTTKAYILTSTLPSSLRNPAILPPPKIPSLSVESGYIGLYTFIVSAIYLSEGARISEGKLERYLKRFNADNYVLNGEKTENVLKKMEKQGYVVKIKDREPGGEEIVDWMVGPRGKVEIGENGAAALVKNVYGKRDVELEQLEDKLEKSLGAGTFRRKTKPRTGEADDDGNDGDEEAAENESHAANQNEIGASRARSRNGKSGRAIARNRGSDPQIGRSSRRSSNFVDDEAEAEAEEDEVAEEESEGAEDGSELYDED